jgi:hypothetical protein
MEDLLMASSIWKLGALAAGVWFAWAGIASAGDDTIRLDAKKSAASLLETGDSTSEFSHADRAKAGDSDDDVEDIHFRYRLGFSRGYYGGGYFFPRFYAFRRGYWNGVYAGGYGGYYPRYYGGYYAPSYAYYSTPIYFSAPVQTYYSNPCVCTIGGADAPTVALTTTRRAPTNPERYDGPSRAATPRDRYDNEPAPKIDPADGRLVKSAPADKKYKFAAYGENRIKDRETFAVKDKK